MYHAAILTLLNQDPKRREHDDSPALAASLLEQHGYHVVFQDSVLNERTQIEKRLREIAGSGKVHLIVTIGGVGFTPYDVMPEATAAVCERLSPGIPEAMRYAAMQVDHRAMLSRAQAGICGNTFIVNLPGASKVVRSVLDAVLPVIDYGVEILEEYAAGSQQTAAGLRTSAFVSEWLSRRI